MSDYSPPRRPNNWAPFLAVIAALFTAYLLLVTGS